VRPGTWKIQKTLSKGREKAFSWPLRPVFCRLKEKRKTKAYTGGERELTTKIAIKKNQN